MLTGKLDLGMRDRLEKALRGIYRKIFSPSPHPLGTRELVSLFSCNPENTFLVSFPRTGSHWLRALVELYFNRPQLTHIFFMKEKKDFILYHTHDYSLDITAQSVIYLYRDPVDTIYSVMRFEGFKIDDTKWLDWWTELYSMHLAKWLVLEKFTKRKTVIRYEKLLKDPQSEFPRVVKHLGGNFDQERFHTCLSLATKEDIKQVAENPKIVDTTDKYEVGREIFKRKYSGRIWRKLLEGRKFLKDFFK